MKLYKTLREREGSKYFLNQHKNKKRMIASIIYCNLCTHPIMVLQSLLKDKKNMTTSALCSSSMIEH